MAELIPVDCGFCRKRFLLKPEQANRDVRCPHCKTVVKIAPPSEAAMEAAAAIKRPAPAKRAASGHRGPAGLHAGPGRPGERAGPGQKPGMMPVRSGPNQSAVIIMAVIIVVAMIGVGIGLWAVYHGSTAPDTTKRTGRHWFEVPEVESPSGSSTDQPATKRTPGGPAAGPTPAGAPSTAATPGTNPATGTAPAAAAPLEIKVERLLGGYKEGTVTYAVGRVANNTDSPIMVLKVTVPILDNSDNPVGEAVAVILNLPPKTTVPLVAEWVHPEGARGNRWDVTSQVNPSGISKDLPALSAEDVIPWPDPNALTMAGVVKAHVTNLGLVPVQTIDAVAILVGEDGKIVGAAKNTVTKEIKPRKSLAISIHWDHCSKTLVKSAEVWVQPAM